MNFQTVIIIFCVFTFVVADDTNEMWDYLSKAEKAVLLLAEVGYDSKINKAYDEAEKRRPDLKFFRWPCPNPDGNWKLCNFKEKGDYELRFYKNGGITSYDKHDDSIDSILAFLPAPAQLPANQSPTKQPPTRQPPTRQPPTRRPPTRQPPARQPPTRQPPTNQLPASVKNLKSATDLKNLLSNDEGAVIGAFESDSQLKQFYLDMAQEQAGKFMANFVFSSDAEVLEKLGTKNGIVIYPHKHKEFNLKPIIYNGTESKEAIRSFFVQLLPSTKPPAGVIEIIQDSCGVKMTALQTILIITTCVVFF